MPEQRGGVRAVRDEVTFAVQQSAKLYFQFAISGRLVGEINLIGGKHNDQMLGIEAFELNKSGLRQVVFPATTSLRNLAMQTFVEDFCEAGVRSAGAGNQLHHEEETKH